MTAREPGKKKGRLDPLDPKREAEAAAALRTALGAMGEDEQLVLDTIEGETGLYELLDALVERMLWREVIIEGVAVVSGRLAERSRRAEGGIERDRALIEQALSIAGTDTLPRPIATLSLSKRPPSLVLTEESEIPSQFWNDGAPSLDRKALYAALKARADALAALPEDPAERAEALAALDAEHPAIPGATLSNGAPSLTIRIK